MHRVERMLCSVLAANSHVCDSRTFGAPPEQRVTGPKGGTPEKLRSEAELGVLISHLKCKRKFPAFGRAFGGAG